MNDASCKKKGVSASPPGNDKCYLLQKGRFFGDEKNNFRFAQGVPLSWNRSHSPTPAPEPSWSDLPGAVHFTALWFRYVKQSEKHLISTLKIAFHVAFCPNVCLKSLIQKKKSWLRFALVYRYTSLELKTAWKKLKRTKPGTLSPCVQVPRACRCPWGN